MPDIATHTKIIATVAPSAAAVAGQTFGIDLWPMIFGATGGGLALIWIDPPLSTSKAIASIAGSTALGGLLGQFLAVPVVLALVHYFDFLKPWEAAALPAMSAALALTIGLFTQSAMPKLLKRAGERAANV